MTPARAAALQISRFRERMASLALAASLLLTASGALAQTTQTRVTEFAYDPNTGLLIQQVSEPNNSAIAVTTDYTYDGFGNQLTSTVSGPDIASRTTSASYTSDGRFAASVTNALGHSETHVTDGRFGNVTSLTGPNGLTTTWEYDGFGRKTREVRADGTETRWTYELCTTQCPAGAVYLVSSQDFTTSSSTPTTAKAIEYLDKLNRVFHSEGEGFDGTPVYADTLFNARGEVTQVSKPYFAGTAAQDILWTTYAYDVVGRRTSVTRPDGGVESTAFAGLTTTLTNALSQTSVRVENALGEIISATDNLGNVTTYSYDAFGSLLSTDAEGVVTTMSYDVRGLKTAMDDPDMGVWSYSYDALGQLTSQTDAKGQTTTMAYDELGRMVSRTEAEGTTTWTYDSAPKGIGKIAGVAAPHINYSEAMAYDAVGRPATASLTVDGETYDTTTLYDAAGRADTLVYPSGFQVRSHFTANGHLASVTDELASVTYWQADTVNAEGQVTAETLGNGATTSRVYDPATSRIDSILTTSGATTIQDLAFDFDTLGNLTARRDLRQDREEAFTYDGLNRLTGTTLTDSATLATLATTSYSYNSLGNLITKSDVAGTYVYGQGGAGPHAVSQIGSAIYSYDANGSMVAGDNKTTAWTSFNKPREIVDTLTGNESWFVYGPSRARVKQQILDGGLTTNVVYVGSHFEVKTRPGEDDELTHYIRAGGSVVAIYTRYDDGYTFTDKTRYLHRDHLGSVAAVTDEAGAVTERFSYDPHGKRRLPDWQAGTPASPAETPRGFTGHEHLDAVGLIHMNGRVYDPTLGRFLSADPFVQYPETTQGFNRYSYTDNNPLSYTDPSGFWADNGHSHPDRYGKADRYDGPDGTTHRDRMERGSGGPVPSSGIDLERTMADHVREYEAKARFKEIKAAIAGLVDGVFDQNYNPDVSAAAIGAGTSVMGLSEAALDDAFERYNSQAMGVPVEDYSTVPGYQEAYGLGVAIADLAAEDYQQATNNSPYDSVQLEPTCSRSGCGSGGSYTGGGNGRGGGPRVVQNRQVINSQNRLGGISGRLSGFKAIAKDWNKGTFGTRVKSFEYHYEKHGIPAGLSPLEYATAAFRTWRSVPVSQRVWVGPRVRNNTVVQGYYKVSHSLYGKGYYTKTGKVISFMAKPLSRY